MRKNFAIHALFLAICLTSNYAVTSTIYSNGERGIKPVMFIYDEGGGLPEPGYDFQGDCDYYGFNISDIWAPYDGTTFKTYTRRRWDVGHLQYQTDVQQVLLQHTSNPNIFSVVYRVVASPVSHNRDWGFLGIGSHSDEWYTRMVETYVTLGSNFSMGDWSPKNEDAQYSGSIGIGAGSSGWSISASVNFEINELEMLSGTNTAIKTYITCYSISGYNLYSTFSSVHIGFFIFSRTSSSVSPVFNLNYNIKYYGRQYFHQELSAFSLGL